MTTPLRPDPEGIKSGTTVLNARGFIPKYELNVGQASSLLERNEEYAFFTPAILYLHGRFRDAPLADYINTMAQGARLYYKKFARPIFRGLDSPDGDRAWNHALWAIAREYWKSFSDWMVSLTLTYEDTQSVARVGEQCFSILDPLYSDRAVVWCSEYPILPIAAFGMKSNRFQAAFSVGSNYVTELPTLYFTDAAVDAEVFAKALYGGDNPLGTKP